MTNSGGYEMEMTHISDTEQYFYSSAHHQAIWKKLRYRSDCIGLLGEEVTCPP